MFQRKKTIEIKKFYTYRKTKVRKKVDQKANKQEKTCKIIGMPIKMYESSTC